MFHDEMRKILFQQNLPIADIGTNEKTAGRRSFHLAAIALRPPLACEELRRLPERLRGSGLETVHQEAVALIVVVEDPPQLLPGRQPPVPLQLDRNRSPID